jgi:quercetin dioxygenase-like cupin family protein
MSIAPAPQKPYVSQSTDHEWLASMGSMEYAIMLDAKITGGQLTVIEGYAGHGEATPFHIHGNDDEGILLLNGHITVFVGDERHTVLPGGAVWLPRHIPHAIRCNIASRLIILNTPGGYQEATFRGAGWNLTVPKPKGWEASIESLMKAGEAAGNTLTGSPPGPDA